MAAPRCTQHNNRAMATYESVLHVTGRFEVVDAHERPDTVLEYTECLHRVSVSKRYPVLRGEVTYRLQDGTPLRRSSKGYFDTLDGVCRLFTVEAVEKSDAAC
jgi:hypothetical protein